MSNDLIGRQDVLDLVKDINVPTNDDDGEFYRYRCIDPDEVLELPSANFEERVNRTALRMIRELVDTRYDLVCTHGARGIMSVTIGEIGGIIDFAENLVKGARNESD